MRAVLQKHANNVVKVRNDPYDLVNSCIPGKGIYQDPM